MSESGQLERELNPILVMLDKAVMNILSVREDTTKQEARIMLLHALVEQFGLSLNPSVSMRSYK